MSINLRGRGFLKELDYTREELLHLVGLAGELKEARRAGAEVPRLTGRNIALIFERASTRTRCSFEVAAHDQGAHVTYLEPATTHIGTKESIRDTARVLGRMFDGIGFRGNSHETVETLGRHAGIPVWNGLTRDWHPTQMLADVLTMVEHCGKPADALSYAFLGAADSNLGNSYTVIGALLGMDVRIVGPRSLWPDEHAVIKPATELARLSGANLTFTEDVAAGVRGADVLLTDVWASMGDPWELWAERIGLLMPYQVNAATMAATGNPRVRFMHCLPAFHDGDTSFGETVRARTGHTELEVTSEVFESAASLVFDQAENRLHTIKAVMVATLAGPAD